MKIAEIIWATTWLGETRLMLWQPRFRSASMIKAM